ncbi:MAG: hypothetical protein HQ558_00185 [Candidatus Omnitrophica bacterium]|nr:hypothetical protein [Candidatus Omnitrophota bacterium]
MIKGRFMRLKTDTSGMTLVEILIVTILLLVVLAGGIYPYMTQQELLKEQIVITELQDEVSVAMSYIIKDIFLSIEADDTTASQLTLTVGLLPEPTSTKTVIYSLSGKDLIRNDAGTSSTIAHNITSLTFTAEPLNYVTVTMTSVKASDTDEDESITMTSGCALRASAAA